MSVKLREKVLNHGRRSLYLDIYHQGHRSAEFLGLYLDKNREHNKETKALAESIRAKKQLEIQSEAYDYTPVHKKKAKLIVFAEKVIQDKKQNESPRGLHNYDSMVKHLKAYAGTSKQLGALNEAWFEGFKAYLSQHISTNTANHYISKLKVILKLAYREGYLSKPFYEKVRLFKQTESKKVFLSSEEVIALANTPCKRPEIKLAFLFACHTGLRHSDISKLTWGEIEGNQINFRQRKTAEFQYQPLNKSAQSILDKIKGGKIIPLPDMPIFNIPDAQHISKHLKPWAKAAGIQKNVTFHSGRHTFATTLLTAGAGLFTVSKLLGHQDIKTTLVYAKIVSEVKENAVNSLPELKEIA